MRHYILMAIVLIAVPAAAQDAPPTFPGNVAPPPGNTYWYRCDAAIVSPLYYPYIGTCPAPWQQVFAEGPLPPQPPMPEWLTRSSPQLRQMAYYNQISEETSEYQARNATAEKQAGEKTKAAQKQFEADAQHERAAQLAIGHGYKLIQGVRDLVLDGKTLAASNAKIQISGYYRKVGDSERLFASQYEAYRQSDNSFPVMTDDAQRPLREFLMSYQCRGFPGGCRVAVGGHVQTCHYLDPQMANYPPVPCLHVEVVIQ